MSKLTLPSYFIHEVTDTIEPKFIKKAKLAQYSVGDKLGRQFFWEFTPNPHNTVHVLVNNTDTKQLLLVKQIRIPVLINDSAPNGEVIECCAGLIDGFCEAPDNQRPLLTAIAEVREELGYDALESQFEQLPSYLGNVGTSGSICYPFYVEVTNDQFVGTNLGDGEFIIPYTIDYSSVINIHGFLDSTSNHTDATTKYLVSWFLINRRCQ